MARIRTVKPTHWADKELAQISLQAHLLWIATWNFSDDEGVFEGDPLLLKSQIFPRRTDIRVDQIITWLDQLVKARFLIPFEYKNEGYYVSRTFKAHQRIDKPQPSNVPFEVLELLFQEHSTNVPRTVLPVEESSSNSKVVVKVEEWYRAFAHLKISFAEFDKLIGLGFKEAEIDAVLDKIENYKNNKNYKSLFLTAKNWLSEKKEKSSGEKEKGKAEKVLETHAKVEEMWKQRAS